MKKLSLLAAALVFAGCQSTSTNVAGSFPPPPSRSMASEQTFDRASKARPYSLNAREVEGVKDGVRSGLRDPYSAVFGPMKAVKHVDGPAIYVCGVVNAKNAFGAFTGYQPYFGLLASHQTGAINLTHFSATSVGKDTTETMCQMYGVIS